MSKNFVSYQDALDVFSEYAEEINKSIKKFSVMPNYTNFDLGTIIQYVGANSGDYVKGYFYERTASGWVQKNTQPTASGLGTAAFLDVAESGDAAADEVVKGNDGRLTDSRPASDVPSWAKESTKPTYNKTEVGLGNVDNTSDTTKKTNFTGSIASGNTGFVTGGDVYTALNDKADKVANATSGNLAGLDSNGNLTDSGYKATNQVTSGSSDLVTSGAVKDAIDTAVSSAYHAAGSKTVAELTSALLIASNSGNVYNMTTSGTASSDFVTEEIGKHINIGDNIAIVNVGTDVSPVYKFDLLSGFVDLSNYVQKSSTAGLIKNDGTIDTNSYALNNAVIKGVQVDGTDLTKDANGKVNINSKATRPSTSTAGDIATLTAQGDLADGGFSFDKDGQTATGNPLSFTADSAQVARECVITFEPIQAGSGDPSPSNVRAISGYDKAELAVPRINQWNEQWESGYIDGDTGEEGSLTNAIRSKSYITILPNTDYFIHSDYGTVVNFVWFDSNLNYISGGKNAGLNTVRTSPSNAKFMRFSIKDYGSAYSGGVSINYPATATEYEPYNPVTDIALNLPETVYGGTLDVTSGVLTVDRAIVDLGDLEWTYVATSGGYFNATIDNIRPRVDAVFAEIYPNAGEVTIANMPDKSIRGTLNTTLVVVKDSRYTDANTFTTAMSGIHACYQLATPYTIHLTPAQVNLLKGANTVTTNGTTITLKYRDGELAKLEDLSGIGESINKLGEYVDNLYEDIYEKEYTDLEANTWTQTEFDAAFLKKYKFLTISSTLLNNVSRNIVFGTVPISLIFTGRTFEVPFTIDGSIDCGVYYNASTGYLNVRTGSTPWKVRLTFVR